MSSPIPVTAIFDIGKTNKKFLLFDENHTIIYKRQQMLPESTDEDGYPCEDLELLTDWVHDQLDKATCNRQFRVKHLNVSTYGATLIHLDEYGGPVTPIYNYLKPYPDDLSNTFYEKYGGQEEFAVRTASPPMGMLNSGLQLYWLKNKKPGKFEKICWSLHLPQYIRFLFTNKITAELTSIGCHTALWDFPENRFHSWLKKEEMIHLMPDILPVSATRQTVLHKQPVQVGQGIHDSSAALAPYLIGLEKPFIQLSTGTWSIAMNPFTSEPLTYGELKKDCLHYINIYGKPVKAARFFMGSEYDHQVSKLDEYFDRSPDQKNCEADPDRLRKIVRRSTQNRQLVLEKAAGSGPYPGRETGEWDLGRFDSYEDAFHQLMLDLVSIQKDSLMLAEGGSDIDQVIITGGFSQNHFFTRLLATFLPEKKVYSAVTSHASALGAALVLHQDKLNTSLIREMLGLKRQKPFENLDLFGYSWSEHKIGSEK